MCTQIHNRNINFQTIAFLAHLKEMGDEGPHLVIVPSSTMENWRIELGKWCPSLKILNYYGQQDERRSMRLQVRRAEEFSFHLGFSQRF